MKLNNATFKCYIIYRYDQQKLIKLTYNYDVNKSYTWNENKMKEMFKAECFKNNLLRTSSSELLAEHEKKTSKNIKNKKRLGKDKNSFSDQFVTRSKRRIAEEDIFFKLDEEKALAHKKTIEFLFVNNNYNENDVASLQAVAERTNFLEICNYPKKMTPGLLYYFIIMAAGKTPTIKNFLLNEEVVGEMYNEQMNYGNLDDNNLLEIYGDVKFSKSYLSKLL